MLLLTGVLKVTGNGPLTCDHCVVIGAPERQAIVGDLARQRNNITGQSNERLACDNGYRGRLVGRGWIDGDRHIHGRSKLGIRSTQLQNIRSRRGQGDAGIRAVRIAECCRGRPAYLGPLDGKR